jgi:hypothetical protein
MTFPAIILLWIFLTLCGVLLVVAIMHVMLGLRYGGTSKAVAVGGASFLIFLALVGWLSWMLLRTIDWSGQFTVTFPGSTTSQVDSSL